MQLSNIQALVFEITSYCNIKCPQCSRTNEDGKLASYVDLQHWDVDKLLPNLELSSLDNLRYVHIEGDTGDALMHPDIEKILDAVYTAPSKPEIDILTHGALRSEEWWFRLGQKYSPDRLRVQFSIDGLEDTHRLYRVGADYNKVVNNAKAFIRGGGNAAQRCLIFKHNQHQLEQIVQKSQEIGFVQLRIMPNDAARFRGLDRWLVVDNGVGTHYIESTDITDFSQYEYNNSSKNWWPNVPLSNNNNETCLNVKKGQIHITYKGHVLPCCMYNADLYFDHPLNQKFKDLVGDVNLVDVNQVKLSSVLSTTYFSKLDNMLQAGEHPGRCNTYCGHEIKFNSSQIYFIPATKR